jgi:hypothetical protein
MRKQLFVLCSLVLICLASTAVAEKIVVTDENVSSFTSLETKGISLFCYEYPNGRLRVVIGKGKKDPAAGMSLVSVKNPTKKVRLYKKKVRNLKKKGAARKAVLRAKKQQKAFQYAKANCKSNETQNLQVTDLAFNEVLYAGHTTTLTYTISAAEAVSQTQTEDVTTQPAAVSAEETDRPQNVVVAFFLVDKQEFEKKKAGKEISSQVYLGDDNLLEVPAGSSAYSVDIKVPKEISAEGKYYLFARMDPDDLIAEKNEDDNQLGLKDADKKAFAAQVSRQFVDVPNFKILSLTLEDKEITALSDDDILKLIPVTFQHLTPKSFDPDTYPYLGNVEIHGSAEVLYDGVWPANLDALKVALELLVNGEWTRLEAWDSTQSKFTDYVSVKFNNDGLPPEEGDSDFNDSDEDNTNVQIIDLDINIPLKVLQDLVKVQQSTLSGGSVQNTNLTEVGLRLVVDSDSAVTEAFEDDNTLETTVDLSSLLDNGGSLPALLTAAASDDTMFEKEYKKYVGRKKRVKSGIKLYSKMGIETGNPYGAVSINSVEVPIWLFNNKNWLLKVSDERSAYADWMEKTGYKTEIIYFNSTLYDEELWYDRVSKSYATSWEKEKRVARTRFVVGPIPIKVSLYVSGSVDIDFEMGLEDNYLFSENKLPEMDFNLDLDGGVDVIGGEAGVTSRFGIIEEKFQANGYAEFDYLSATDQLLSAKLKTHVVNDLEMIRGKFGLYARWRTIKWCKKWGIPYPCGTKKRKKTIWFYKTKALYNKKNTILEKEKSWTF